MNNKKAAPFWPVPDELIAKFGPVCLYREADGRHRLGGGTAEQRAAARQWCTQHTPFIQFAELACPGRHPTRLCRRGGSSLPGLFTSTPTIISA